jgi:hypothetical protein
MITFDYFTRFMPARHCRPATILDPSAGADPGCFPLITEPGTVLILDFNKKQNCGMEGMYFEASVLLK